MIFAGQFYNMKNIGFGFIFLILSYDTALAQDRVFARTYQSNVIPKGSFDIEYFATLRTGKSGDESPYHVGRKLDTRLEFEFGLGHNLQTAFYLNTNEFIYTLKDSSNKTGISGADFKTSFSNEWKLKLSDPVANSVGSGLYLELTAGADEYEIETKFILDKRYSKHLFALNITGELEFETELELKGTEIEKEIELEFPFELNIAYMYFLKQNLGLGFEFRNQNKIESGNLKYAVLFGGPTIYFNQGHFFGAFNILPQWTNLKKEKDVSANIDHIDHEDLEMRLLIGYSF